MEVGDGAVPQPRGSRGAPARLGAPEGIRKLVRVLCSPRRHPFLLLFLISQGGGGLLYALVAVQAEPRQAATSESTA